MAMSQLFLSHYMSFSNTSLHHQALSNSSVSMAIPFSSLSQHWYQISPKKCDHIKTSENSETFDIFICFQLCSASRSCQWRFSDGLSRV